MGRILEALSQKPDAPVRPRVHQPEPDAAPAEDVPFIEVGGPNRAVEGSPDVLAGTRGPAARPAVSLTPAEPVVIPPSPRTEMPAAAPSVFLRPLPVEPPPLSPSPERLAKELIVFHRPDDPASDQYRELLASVELQLPAGRPQVLLYTARGPGAGTTTTLLNLAVAAAQTGDRRVLVVDANLRRPALAERLGLRAAPGLGDVLAGSAPLAQALQETGQEDLHALTVGRRGNSTTEGFRSLFGLLRQRFDRVLVDASAWDGRPELLGLCTASDAVYVVVRQEEEPDSEVQELLRSLPEQGVRLHGSILVRSWYGRCA